MRSALLALCMTGCLSLGSTIFANAAEDAQAAPQRNASNTAGDDLFAAVRQQIQREMEESGVPSVAVAVARKGKIIWEEAFGWADLEKKIPATVNTMYSLASVSKPMTATGLMVLVERGKLDLDTPVNHYLAKDSQMTVWIGDPEEVTLRRLANHTAGLPRHEHFYEAEEIPSMPPMEESIRRYGNIVTPPGERYRYSNFGYGILDHVIARASGMSFADFMRQEVFVPLGMTRTSVDIGPGLAEFASVRYDESNHPIPFYSFDHAGASGVWSSVHDLVRFGMFHLGQLGPDQKAILSSDTLAAMKVPTASMNPANLAGVNLGQGSCYGIGWVIYDDGLGRRINHSGGMGGAASELLLMPEEGIVVAVVANKFCELPGRVQRGVLSVVLPDYAAKVAERGRARREARGRRAPPEFKATPELLGDWEGRVRTYAGDFPITLSFKESGAIYARLGEQGQVPVTSARFADGRLAGSMAGRMDAKDARRLPWPTQSNLDLDLKLRGDVLNGAIVATAGDALSYWVELRQKGSGAATDQAGSTASPRRNNKP